MKNNNKKIIEPIESLYEPEPKSRFNWWKVLGGLVIALIVCLLLIDIVSAEQAQTFSLTCTPNGMGNNNQYSCTMVGGLVIDQNNAVTDDSYTASLGLKRVMEIGLVVLIVLIILIGLIIGFNKLKDDDDLDENEESYY